MVNPEFFQGLREGLLFVFLNIFFANRPSILVARAWLDRWTFAFHDHLIHLGQIAPLLGRG